MTHRSKTTAYGSRYSKLYRSGHRLTLDATVPRRQLQALHAIGYSRTVVSAGTGLHPGLLTKLAKGRQTRTYQPTAKAVGEFYEAHHSKPLSGPIPTRVRTWAAKAQFAPPAAYDDITDITEVPKGVRKK